MGQDPGTVDPLPPEEGVRKAAGHVPVKLHGEKVIDPGPLQDLGQGAVETEGVRQPGDRAGGPELLPPEAGTLDNLPHQRFAPGQVAVRLHPQAAQRLPAPLGDPGLDLPVEFRVMIAAEAVLDRLGVAEDEIGIRLHQPQGGGEGPAALADRFAHRPEVGGIQVAVAQQTDLETGLGPAALQETAQDPVGADEKVGRFRVDFQGAKGLLQHRRQPFLLAGFGRLPGGVDGLQVFVVIKRLGRNEDQP
ncbi:MAG: hypothetical protein BWY73_01201 [candidate division TA06 bacterium ADurb.Bin417]|uniref:Uncharacterized protein n=1 Tax=candidate division TA06 bacterium ADurb.Bin417 TaxID=1852828 RepID=A0A1V5MCM7_UNCT6|nr:MAG: hypothetical protein BWY73_01201 [candidate division TA06 bacterium ADurb.Bin417]